MRKFRHGEASGAEDGKLHAVAEENLETHLHVRDNRWFAEASPDSFLFSPSTSSHYFFHLSSMFTVPLTQDVRDVIQTNYRMRGPRTPQLLQISLLVFRGYWSLFVVIDLFHLCRPCSMVAMSVCQVYSGVGEEHHVARSPYRQVFAISLNHISQQNQS